MVFKNLCLVIVLFVYYSSTSASDDLMTQLLRQVTQEQAETISRAQSIARNYILHTLTVVRNRIINFNGYHTIVENIVEGLQSRELEPLKIVKDRSFLKSMEPPTLHQLAKVIYSMQGCNEATDYSISKWESVLSTISEISTYLTPIPDLNISEPEYEIVDKLDRPFVNFVLMAVYYNNLNVTNTLLQGILENYAFDPYSPDLVPLMRNVNNRLSSETLANFQLEAPLGRMATEDLSSATLKRILSSIATRPNLEPQFVYQIELIRSSLEMDVLGRKEDDSVAEWLSAMRQGDYPDDILKARDELMEMVRSGLLLTKTELNTLREDMIGHSPSARVLGLLGRLLAVPPSDPAATKVYALYSHAKLRQLAQSESYFIPRSVADISFLLNSFLTVKNQVDFGLVQQIDDIFMSPDFDWNALYRDFDFSKYSDPRRLLLGMLKHIVHGYKLQVCHVIVINYFLQQNTDNCSPMTPEPVNNQLEGSNTSVLPVLVTSGDNTTGVVSALTPKNCTNGPPVRVIDPDCLIEIIDSKQHAGFITDLIKYNPTPAEKLPYNTRYEVFTALLGDLKENKYTDDVSEFVISQAMLRLPVNEKANFPPTYKLLCPEEIELLEWKAPTTQAPVSNTPASVPPQSAEIPPECYNTTQVIDRDSLWHAVNTTHDWSRLQAVLYAEPVLYGDYSSLTTKADVLRTVLERRNKNLNNKDIDAIVNTFLVMSPFTPEGQQPPVVLLSCAEKPSYNVNSPASTADVQEVQNPEITPTFTTSSTYTNTIENIHTAETLKYTDATQTQTWSEPCKSNEELTLIIDTDALLTLLSADAPKARFLRSRIRSYVIPVTPEMNYTRAETLKYILDAIREEMKDARVAANVDILKGYIQESGPGSEPPATSYACLPKGGKVTQLCYRPRFEMKECPQSACSADETVTDVIDTDSLFDALRPGAWKSIQVADMIRVYIMPIDPSKYYKKGDVLRDVLRDLLKNVNDTAVQRDINAVLNDIVTGGPADERPRTVSVCFPKAYLIGSTPPDAAGLCVLPEVDQVPAAATGVSGSSRYPFPTLPTISYPQQLYSQSPTPAAAPTPSSVSFTTGLQQFNTPSTPPPSQLPIVYPASYSETAAPVVIGNTPFPSPTVSLPMPLPPKESATAVAADSSPGTLPIPNAVPFPHVETATEPTTVPQIQAFSQISDTRHELISSTPTGVSQSIAPSFVAAPPNQNEPNSNPAVPPAAQLFNAISTHSVTAPGASIAPPAVAESSSINTVPEQGVVIPPIYPQPERTDAKSAAAAVASPTATPGEFPIATPNIGGVSLYYPSPTQNAIVSSPPQVASQSYQPPGYFTTPTRSPAAVVAAEVAPVADTSSTQLPPQYVPASTPTPSFQTVNYPLPQQITVIYPQGVPSAASANSNGTLPQNMLVSVPSLLFHVVGVQPNPTVVTLPPAISNPPPLSVAAVSSDSISTGQQDTIVTYPPYQPQQPVMSNPAVAEPPVSGGETPQNFQPETNPSSVSVQVAAPSDAPLQPVQPEITQVSPNYQLSPPDAVQESISNNPSPPVEDLRLPKSHPVQIPENAMPPVPFAQSGSSAVAVDVDANNGSLWQFQQVTLSYPSNPQGAPSAAAEILTITSNQPWPVQYIPESSPLPVSWSPNPSVAVAAVSSNTPWNMPLPVSVPSQQQQPVIYQPPGNIVVPSPTPGSAVAVAVDSAPNTYPPQFLPQQPAAPQSPIPIPTQPPPSPTPAGAAVAVAADSPNTNSPPILGLSAVSPPYQPIQPAIPQSPTNIPTLPPSPPTPAGAAVAVAVDFATNTNPPSILSLAVSSPYQPLQPIVPQSPVTIPTQPPPSPTPTGAAVAVAVDSGTNTNPPPSLGVPVSSPYQSLQPIPPQSPVAIPIQPSPSTTPVGSAAAVAVDSASNTYPPPFLPLQPVAPQSPMPIPTQPPPSPSSAEAAVAVAADSPTNTNSPPILGPAVSPPYQPIQPVVPQSPTNIPTQPPTPEAPAVAVAADSGSGANPPPVPDLPHQPIQPIVPQFPTAIPTQSPQSPTPAGSAVVAADDSATNTNPPSYQPLQPIVPQSPFSIPSQPPPSLTPAAPAVAVDFPTNTNPDLAGSPPYQPVQPIVPQSSMPIPTQSPPPSIPAGSDVAAMVANTGSTTNGSPLQFQGSPPSQPVIFQPSGEAIPPTPAPVEPEVAVAADSTTNSVPVQGSPAPEPPQTEQPVISQSSGEVVPPPPAPAGPVVEVAGGSTTNPSSLPVQDAGVPLSNYPVQPIPAQLPYVTQPDPNPPAGPGVAVAADSASNATPPPPQPQLEAPQTSLIPQPSNLQPSPVALSPPSYPSQFQSPNPLPAAASAAAASSGASPINSAQPEVPPSPFSSHPIPPINSAPEINSESVNTGSMESFTTEPSLETTETPTAIYQGYSAFLSPSFAPPITPSPLQLSPYAQAMFPSSSPQPELSRLTETRSEGYPAMTSFTPLIRSSGTSPPSLYQSSSPFVPHKVFIPNESQSGGAASASSSQGNPSNAMPPQGYFPVSVEQTTPGSTANNAFGDTTGTASSADSSSGQEPPTSTEGNYNTGQVGSQQGSNLEDDGSVISVDNIATTGISGMELIQETTEIYYNPTEAPEMANIVLTAPSNPNASIGYMHPLGNASLPGYYELLKWPILLKPEGNQSCYDNRNQVFTSPVLVINITSLFDVINPSGASELDEYLTATYLTSLDTYYKLAYFQFKNHTTKEEFLRDVLQYLLKSEERHDITEPMKRILNVIPETTSTPLQLGALCNYRIYEELPKRRTQGNLTLRYVSNKPCQSGVILYEAIAVTDAVLPKKVEDEMKIFSEMASRNRIFDNVEWEKLPTQSDFGQLLMSALQTAAVQHSFIDLSDYLQREIPCQLWKTSRIAVQIFCQPMLTPHQLS